MRGAIGKWFAYSLSALLLALPAFGALPLKLGELALDSGVESMLISDDQHYLYVQLQAGPSSPPKIVLIDVANPAALVKISEIPINSTGQMALTPDGKWLRLAAPINELPDIGGNKQHELTTFDVSQPAQPLLHSRQNLQAKQLVLAPDASAYAIYREAEGKDGHNQIEVSWLENRRPVLQLKPGAFVDLLRLTARGEFVAYQGYDFFEISDLRQAEVRLYGQILSEEFSNEVLATLDSLYASRFIGQLDNEHLLFSDFRTARIGVYALKPNLPRVATLPYSAEADRDFSMVELGRSNEQILLRDENAYLFKLNSAEPANLRLTATEVSLPGCRYHRCLVDRTERLFLADEESELQSNGIDRLRYYLRVFDTRQTQQGTFSWQKLAEVHQMALPRYRAAQRQKDSNAEYQAFGLYQQASPLLALTTHPDTISSQQAAKIISEYAELMAEHSGPRHEVKALLRYAIQLDARFAEPHLQLAKLLRESLPKINNWPDKLATMQQVRQHYQRYLALGGKASADITAYVTYDPVAKSKNICEAIVNFTNAGRQEEILSEIGIDVPIGDKKYDLVFSTQGTLHEPIIYYFNSDNDAPPLKPNFFDGREPPSAPAELEQLAMFGSDYHILDFNDLRHPVASTNLSGTQYCKFAIQTQEKIGPKASEPALCRLLQTDKAPKSISFSHPLKPEEDDQEDISEEYLYNYPYNYPGAETLGSAMVDLSNDGKLVNVGKIQQQNDSCRSIFFDTLEKHQRGFVKGQKHDLLMQLQQMQPEPYCPVLPVVNNPRFFKYRGKTYFETKAATWPPIKASDQIHRVSRVKNGKVIEVCDYQFATRVNKAILKNTPPKSE